MMQFDRSIASLGLGITYFLQVVLAYLTTLSISAFIRNARLRVRIWGGFLVWAIAAWVLLWIPARETQPVLAVFHSVPLPPTARLHIAMPVAEPWASYFARVSPTVAFLYFSSLLISIVYLCFESRRLKSALRRTHPPSPQLQACFERLCHELHVGRCELRLAADLRSPATCYWWRSHVLLPLELVPHLDSDQLEDVLRHELFHVRQRDYLWDRLAALGCRVVFFHPLVWLAYRHLRWERELACDYAVVRESSEARLRYAECLTNLARWFMAQRTSSPGITFFSSESLLKVRVRAVLSKPSICSPSREAARAGLVSVLASVVLLLLPGLGLSLYSPIRLTSFLVAPENARSSSVRKKGAGTKAAHSSTPKTLTMETLQMTPRSGAEESIKSLLDIPPAALPVLSSSTADEDTGATTPTSVKEDVGLQSRHAIWDETPMPLASPPKWRTLAIGAITGAVGMVTGQVDPDDIDGPRKRTR
jgi:beta-lactamase regulating signal transducer with metallopeptidase domain